MPTTTRDRQQHGMVVRWRQLTTRADAGTSTISMVIVAIVFVVIALFAVCCWRITAARMDAQAAAHTAARAASLHPDNATTTATTTAAKALAGQTSCRDQTITVDNSSAQPGGRVRVHVTCRVDLTGLGPAIPDTGTSVTATATAPIDTWISR